VLQKRLQRCVEVTFTGLLINGVLAGGKMFAGIVGHSHALVADAVESLSDIFSSIVVWRGLVVAAEPADEDHPYGHGKAEPIAAAMVSTVLLAAAAWIAVTAFAEVREPHLAPAPFTLVVLLAVVVIKEGLYRFVSHESTVANSTALHTDAWHHRSDAITSAAAAVGISVSLIGGKGYEAADDYAAMVAALVIAWNGWRLLRQALGELMDQSPSPKIVEEVRRLALATPGVECIEKCLVRKMGYTYFVDLHAQVDPEMTVRRSHEIAHAIKDQVRAGLPAVHDVLVHIEPCLPPYRPASAAQKAI